MNKENHTHPGHRICTNNRMCRCDLLPHILRRPSGISVPGQSVRSGNSIILLLLASREGQGGEKRPHWGGEPVVDVVPGCPDRVATRARELDHAQHSVVAGYILELAVGMPHLVDRRDLGIVSE